MYRKLILFMGQNFYRKTTIIILFSILFIAIGLFFSKNKISACCYAESICCAACGQAQARTCCNGSGGCVLSKPTTYASSSIPIDSIIAGGYTCGGWSACQGTGAPSCQCAPPPPPPPTPPPPPPPPPCTSSAPGAATLSSPVSGTLMHTNDVPVSWTNPTGWGVGCPQANQFRVYTSRGCTGTYVLSSTVGAGVLNTTLNDLEWSSTYCWYVQKTNGSQVANSAVWQFSINNTPTITGSSFTNADVCGTGTSGRAGTTGTTNPVTYRVSFNDTEGDQYREVWLVFAPSTGPYAQTTDPEVDTVVNGKIGNSQAIGVKIDLINNTVHTITNAGAWSVGASSGDLTNQAGTATVLGFGTNTIANVSGNTVTADFQIRFDNTFPVGNYNIYTAALTRTSAGIDVTSNATGANNRMYKRTGTWIVDTANPSITVTGPTFNGNGTFSVNWAASDTGTLTNVFGYIYADKPGTQIQDQTIPLTINPPNTQIGYPANPANAGITMANLGNHTYNDLTKSLFANYSFVLYGRDNACNIGNSNLSVDSPSPWSMGYLGSVSANGGVTGFNIPNTSNFTTPYSGDPPGIPYLSPFSAFSGNGNIVAQRQSKQNVYSINYVNVGTKPPLESGFTTWYDYLLDLVIRNSQTTVINFSGNQTISGDVSKFILPGQFATNFRYIVTVNGNLTINANTNCDVKSMIFVTGSVTVNPDTTVSSDNSCGIISKGDVTINNGSLKTVGVTLSNSTGSSYDNVYFTFVTDGTLHTLADNSQGTNYKWDGLYISGGVIANNLDLERDLNFNANFNQPAQIFVYDPRFRDNFKHDLARSKFSVREVK